MGAAWRTFQREKQQIEIKALAAERSKDLFRGI
jgi:hypothetical protein